MVLGLFKIKLMVLGQKMSKMQRPKMIFKI
jgi:hypothetical protein